VLLDQGGKLIVGDGRAHVRSALSFVALLFVAGTEKITTLGKVFDERLWARCGGYGRGVL
jgi:hypothetical protein